MELSLQIFARSPILIAGSREPDTGPWACNASSPVLTLLISNYLIFLHRVLLCSLAVLEFTLLTRLASSPQRFFNHSLLSAGTEGVSRHACLVNSLWEAGCARVSQPGLVLILLTLLPQSTEATGMYHTQFCVSRSFLIKQAKSYMVRFCTSVTLFGMLLLCQTKLK